jgi:secondary thiamine-phosphate synthase enzyme
MRIAQTRLSIETAPREIKEITAEVARWVGRQPIAIGLLTVYLPHTSASLLIQENASPDVLRDLDTFLRRLVPEDVALYRHNDEGPDDMPAHIKSALTQTQLTIPVTDGRIQLSRPDLDRPGSRRPTPLTHVCRAPTPSRRRSLSRFLREKPGKKPAFTPIFHKRYSFLRSLRSHLVAPNREIGCCETGNPIG